jgi:diguanylate cyclase (GGDEF)-like protein
MNLELLKTFTILYVEDEATLREDVYQNISPFIKKVITCVNGVDGLKTFIDNRDDIDLIITDILMPVMNGIEMVDEIRKLDSQIPIIYTTAFSDSDYLKKTIEQSIVSYIVKPIDIEILLKGIEKASLKIENERLKTYLLEINKELESKIELKTKELRLKNEMLYKQLYTDELTSIPNRKSLLKDISTAINPLLAIVDIDAFGTINDLYGEKVGNQVLTNIALLLDGFAKPIGCSVYRMGGDIFALFKDEEFNLNECVNNIENLIQSVNNHSIYVKQHDITIRIAVTIGISTEHLETVEKANMALMKAKEKKLAYILYGDEHNLDKEYANDIKWTKIIQKAVESDNVIAYYQPILNKEQKIVKYECLMRIVENQVVHLPYLFLGIAKKVKFYPMLTKIIIKTAFKKAKETQKSVNINLSIQDIVNLDIIDMIKDGLQEYEVAHLITFELLESESITDYEKVLYFINIVRDLGSKIAIDDFGSGYSNFAYLLKLKPDYIKIDGSLVKNIHKDENAYLITKTINDFAHALGMKTVAEFVHCEEVLEKIKEIGVDEYQGFYFSEPLESIK